MPLTEAQRAYQRDYYQKNREARLAAACERQKRYREEKQKYDAERRIQKGDALRAYDQLRNVQYHRRIHQIVRRAKVRAEKRGVPFDLTVADILVPEYCPALGIKLQWNHRQGGRDDSPSLDRVVPELGYVRGNIVIVSAKANRIKTNATADEIQAVASWLKKVSSRSEGPLA